MRLVRFASCVLALACLTASARAEELPGDVTQALGEYAAKRADVMRRADAELAKHKQTLLKKMEKAQQAHKADIGDVPKQIEDLMVKINGPAFTTFEIAEILKGNAITVDTATAKQLQRAYLLNQMTDAQWESLPQIPIEAKCGSMVDTELEASPGQVFVICPHPSEKWKIRSSDWSDYRGLSIKPEYLRARVAVEQETKPNMCFLRDSIVLKAEQTGPLKVGCQVPDPSEADGIISFKIFRVQDR